MSNNSIKEVPISKFFSDKSMNQIYNSGLEFAFVNAEGIQCHPFAFCKDFLQDAIWAQLNKKAVGIWGFAYDPEKNPPLDLGKMRMALRYKGTGAKDFKQMCLRSLDFIHQLDEEQGFEPTELQYGGRFENKQKGPPVYVFVSDKRWLFSPVLVSFYTLALRVGLTYEGGDWRKHFGEAKEYKGKNDKRYTQEAKKVLDKLVGKKPEEVFAAKMETNYPSDCPTSSLHDRSGVVSYAKGIIPDKLKSKWQSEKK